MNTCLYLLSALVVVATLVAARPPRNQFLEVCESNACTTTDSEGNTKCDYPCLANKCCGDNAGACADIGIEQCNRVQMIAEIPECCRNADTTACAEECPPRGGPRPGGPRPGGGAARPSRKQFLEVCESNACTTTDSEGNTECDYTCLSDKCCGENAGACADIDQCDLLNMKIDRLAEAARRQEVCESKSCTITDSEGKTKCDPTCLFNACCGENVGACADIGIDQCDLLDKKIDRLAEEGGRRPQGGRGRGPGGERGQRGGRRGQ